MVVIGNSGTQILFCCINTCYCIVFLFCTVWGGQVKPDPPCLSYVFFPVPILVEFIWQADWWCSLFTRWVGLGGQAWHLCGVTQGESFARLIFPGFPTRICLVWRHPFTAGVAIRSNVPAPWTHVCTVWWTTPKWCQSYYWRIHTSSIRVFVTLLQGGCMSFSGYPPCPHPVAHQRKR